MRWLILTFGGWLVTLGCNPQVPAKPQLLPDHYYTPSIAASAGLTLSAPTIPSPTPPSPAPAGKCDNCNGTGRLGDGTVSVSCPVCGGDGIVSEPPKEPPPSASRPAVPQVKATAEVSIDWVRPEDNPLALSARTGKPLWIHCTDLSGSCRVCEHLERQVFTNPQIIQASKDYICVRVPWDHPWRPALSRGEARPIDCFSTADDWKSMSRSYCPTTVQGYLKVFQSHKEKPNAQDKTAAVSSRVQSRVSYVRYRTESVSDKLARREARRSQLLANFCP